MRKLLLVLCLALFAPVTPPVQAQTPVPFDFFYTSLDPYGQWVQVGDYGYCWHPNNVGADWRPYADGYWANTDAGWTWVSYEDFGWITYHYGRWVRVENYGWCWVPDTQWAPAWVSWRVGDEYVGWAPLPPEAHFQFDIGFTPACDAEYDIGPSCYNFCEVRSFGSPFLRPLLLDPSGNVPLVGNTVNVTNITYRDNAIVNGGPDFRVMSNRSAQPIQTLQLVRRTEGTLANPGNGGAGFARRIGNQFVVAAPNVAPSLQGMRPARVAQVLPQQRVDKGWNGISDPNMKARVRAKFAQESATAQSRKTEVLHPFVRPQPERQPETATTTAPSRKTGVLQPFSQPRPVAREAIVEDEKRAVQSQQQRERTPPAPERNQAAREQQFPNKPVATTAQPAARESSSSSGTGKDAKSPQQKQQQ